jgi:hypothetical protein
MPIHRGGRCVLVLWAYSSADSMVRCYRRVKVIIVCLCLTRANFFLISLIFRSSNIPRHQFDKGDPKL